MSSSVPEPPNEPGAHPPPQELDYELIRLIGRGGYGEVWLVRDQAGAYRACKVVYRESFSHDRPYEREFDGIRKFEPVSRASDNQVRILHVGRRDHAGYFYYIMELADDAHTGTAIDPERYIPKTLRSEVQRRGRLPARECIELGIGLGAALEHLHGHGLIHRDIKPANIIFVRGAPRLADIGLVTDADLTISYVGTGGFIPPEGPTSAQADVYGLGKVLYEISTGKDRLEFPELPVDVAGWPDHELWLELNAVIVKACEADPRRRYASAKELRADLTLLRDGKSVRRARAVRRNGKLAAAAVSIFATLALLAAGIAQFKNHGDRNPPALPPVANKIPYPDASRLAAAQAKLEQRYRAALSGTATSSARLSAANELWQHSATAEDPTVELASLDLAALLSAEAGNYSRTMEICRRIDARFQTDILPFKLKLLSHASAFAQTAEAKTTLAEASIAAGFEAVATNDYATARRLADLARTSAQSSADSHAIHQADFLGAEVSRCEREYERVRSSFETLREKPTDARASLVVGKFLCFVKNDWESGLPLMAHGDDESLKTVLERELSRRSAVPAENISLGDVWWDLSIAAADADKIFFQQRARYWYLKGIATAAEPDKTRWRTNLAERIQSAAAPFAEVHLSSRVNRGDVIELYSDEVRWKSNHGSAGDRMNQVAIGDLAPGTTRVVRNSGATRLFPENVDFSTARLTVDHKPRRRGRTELQVEADHLRLTLQDPPAGSASFEVTLTFGSPP